MSFNIIATEPFERKLKRLAKKHKSLKADLLKLIEQLEEIPLWAFPLEKNVLKYELQLPVKARVKVVVQD